MRSLLWAGVAVAFLAGCHGNQAPENRPSPEDEEVNVGYGTLPKSSITGSVQTLKAKDLETARYATVQELIEGRFAGVQVLRQPGGGFAIRIRGVNSIMGNNEPLIVLDGVPISSAGGNALMGINPRDIDRIEVLKDAGSTAIYGIRGANGVILINTKRAR